MSATSFEWKNTKQLSVVQFLLATFLPSGIAYVGFRVVLPILVKNGTPILVGWPAIASIMLFVFVLLAIFLLRSEAKQLRISLWERMCFKRLSGKEWGIAIGLLVLAFVLAMGVQGIVPAFIDALGLSVPEYMPFFLNPNINPATADSADLSPGFALQGQYSVLILFALALFLNILTEELYFRAWMLPKLSKYGSWGWVINGVLFAFYHSFQIWLLPLLLVSSLSFAFIFYKTKSIWPILATHLLLNTLNLLPIVGMITG
jgi:membrane protease YdiL (CAAX protease family)